MTQPDALTWYDRNAAALAVSYEAHDPAALHGWALNLLPRPPGRALDVGAGTGRDAAWLALRGLEVVAVEPSPALREHAKALHPTNAIGWLDDRLPELRATVSLGLQFDLVWLSAVWQHVEAVDRPQAFRTLATLLKPGGLMLLSLRHGAAEPERAMHPVSLAEAEHLAQANGLAVLRTHAQEDQQQRAGVSWTSLALQLPAEARSPA